LNKESLEVNIKPTCSREKESQFTGKEYSFRPLHRNLEASTKNLRGKQMHPNKVKIIRHVSIVERMGMWRRSSRIRETI